ncbi:MAG: ABC transporter permease, partial [Acidobacteriota bacterium]|nr:ABC transporter permease [Acidobacteriota bacterium]
MSWRLLYHIARADFLERVRTHRFLLTLAGAVYFGYLVNAGYVSLSLGGYRGVFSSAWVGSLTAVVVSTLLSLIGFFLVKNTLERDRSTRVGEILAATPLSRLAYTTGKAVSNFLVLGSIVVVLAAAGVLLQLLAHEDRTLDLGAFLAPLVWIGLPPMALVAALAVLWETVTWLRGSLGNVLYFFAWTALLALSITQTSADMAGIQLLRRSMARQAAAAIPGYQGGFALSIGPRQRLDSFHWSGIEWSGGVIAGRLAWVAAACAVAGLAALLFTRFDPAREGGRRPPPSVAPSLAAARQRRRVWR